MPDQEKSVWNNQNLFSNNYLEHRLRSTSLWNTDEGRIVKVFENIKNVYAAITSLELGPGEEAGLEDKFIRPVLTLLGYEWDVQPTTERGTKKKRPDYALFKDKPSLEDARREKDHLTRFFSHPLTILEAKYWGRRLNDADPNDTLDRRDPTAQTVKYLDDVYYASDGRMQWAILTNGKQWRLFYNRAASRSGNFYEVDLEEIIQSNNFDTFKYFYLFFAKNAFIPDSATGKTWLDQHLKGSEDYATRVSENLKELIFDSIFECLATGFIEYRRIESGINKETNESLKEIFNGCLALLYRLLFLLYAESRSLLPVNDTDRYYKKSLKKLKEDIARDLETTGIENISHNSYDYWSRLESLCRIIDKGDKVLNIPIYNGGLFETPQGSFLTSNMMSDPFIAQAIDLLTIDLEGEYTPGQKPFIDYSSLSVRHLGDIYEGLLEFHVRIADEPMIEVKERGKFLWKKRSEVKAGDKTCSSILEKGDVYIENSKHERKATGSYYTPHYIVEYIVKNAVGPVLDERLEKAKGILSELEALYERQRKQLKKPKDWKHWEHPGEPKGSYIDEIVKLEKDIFEIVFDIKVLDPAMGSGHFLVHAVDFITDRIITFLADFPENPVIRRINEMKGEILEEVSRQGVKIDETKLTEVNLIKRTVMKRCIYGVDLNEMAVELAKLSLWLDSFTLGAPLSFLDHHLKCGNSLIGTNLEALYNAIKGQMFKVNMEPLNRAIRNMLFVSSLSDATYQQVKDSERKYRDADKSIGGYRILLDILVSEYFGIEDAKSFLLEKGSLIDLDNLKKSIDSMHKKDREAVESIEKIAREKRFFHWDIEFPEVFFERVGALEQKVETKENPGFDCVIGNPPYYTLTLGKKQEQADLKELAFYKVKFPNASEYKMNTFALFMEHSLQLIKNEGRWSLILPNTILTNYYLSDLRKWFLDNYELQIFIDLKYRVFPEAEIGGNSIIILRKGGDKFKNITRFATLYDSSQLFQSTFKYSVCSQQNFINLPDYKLLTEPHLVNLLSRFSKNCADVDSLVVIYQGVITGENKKFLANKPIDKRYRKILRGEDIDRYTKEFNETYILYDPDQLWSNTNPDMFFVPLKIISRQTSDHLVATIDNEEYLTLDSTHVIHSKSVNLWFFLALFNSNLLNFIYQNTVPEVGKTFAQIKAVNLKRLPIPSIAFITPKNERAESVKRFKILYSSCKYDGIIAGVETCLPEKSDVVHDLLACLAEQMIEMNKKKNEEIKGFLKWFEREIGAEIVSLANKTAIKEYHKHDFNQLLEVLKKNRNKVSITPSDRKSQELLENHYTKSLLILEPLKTRIKATDELIDEIVYRLYGLTEKEIEVVKKGGCD